MTAGNPLDYSFFSPAAPGSHSITIRAAGTGTLDHTVNLTVVVQ